MNELVARSGMACSVGFTLIAVDHRATPEKSVRVAVISLALVQEDGVGLAAAPARPASPLMSGK